MPFRDVADPEQIAMLAAVLNDICDDACIEPQSPEHKQMADLIMRFYWGGCRTAGQLKVALNKAMGLERYG